jgi:hypothetical protein
MTQKIVINTRHGGFGLSEAAMSLYREFCLEVGGTPEDYDDEIARDNPQLVRVVVALGNSASGKYANLKIVEVPDGVTWTIHEYDGSEWVAEAHRTWS